MGIVSLTPLDIQVQERQENPNHDEALTYCCSFAMCTCSMSWR